MSDASEAEGYAFAPAPSATNRRDGWTPLRQHHFILALSRIGTVSGAARAVGKSPASAYALRKRAGAEGFAAAWDTAIGEGYLRAFDYAMDRAINGYVQPRYYAGRQVGTIRRYDNRTIMAALMRER